MRPLCWKGSASERRLLRDLGLSEAAAQAALVQAAAEATGPAAGHSHGHGHHLHGAERGRGGGSGGGGRQLGMLASFGETPRGGRPRAEANGGAGGGSGVVVCLA